ncbi:MAG TPA: aldehyde dehydrogenase family protein [Pseudonocardia sp.]
MSDTLTEAPESPGDLTEPRMYIDDRWHGGAGPGLPIINPATGRPVGRLPDADDQDVERAVRAASAAFADGRGEWPSRPVAERVAVLGRVLDVLQERAEQVAMAEVVNGGMTIRTAYGFHALGGPRFMRGILAQAPSDALQGLPMQELPTLSANYLRREPIGVVVAMPPSNAGYFLGLYKVISALVTGNTVVLKPSPLASLGCVEIAKAIAAEPAIPPGAFNLVLGGALAGSSLTAHPLVDKIAFTGSAETGRKVLASAAPNFARVTLELGGKGPAIVLDDANLDHVVEGATFGFLNQTGQACTAGSRLLVPASLHQELVDRLSDRVARLVIGDPLDHQTDLGPVVSAAQRDRIEGYVARARAAGAVLVRGGRRPNLGDGFYVEPTIFDQVSNTMELAREEIFGPVLSVIGYTDDEDARRIANDSCYGLTATVWSGDIPRALALAKQLRAGTVWINDHHMVTPLAPFGGYKHSGIGRMYGLTGLESFTEVKHVHIDLHGNGGRPTYGGLLGH